jgi:hypothetical protein
MNFKPILHIENTFLRRVVCIPAIAILGFIGFFIALPIAAFLDEVVAVARYIYRSIKALVWDFPVKLYRVNKEMAGVMKLTFREAWNGPQKKVD